MLIGSAILKTSNMHHYKAMLKCKIVKGVNRMLGLTRLAMGTRFCVVNDVRTFVMMAFLYA